MSYLIVLGAFLACAVEMVEALTIVLGVGVVRGWRFDAHRGSGRGGRGMLSCSSSRCWGRRCSGSPIQGLRLRVGALLLELGLQWLKKAILRSSGYKALHDEDEAFRGGVRRRPRRAGCGTAARGWTGSRSRSRSRACCSRASRSWSS